MFEKVNNDLVAAMKSGDKFTLSVLRMLKSALIYEQTNGEKHELSDDDVLSVIKKQVKTRKTSMEEYLSYDRKDLADNLQKEIDILSKYLPEELSDEKLTKIIDEIITELKPDGMKGMGMVIKAVSAKCGAAADMKKVSSIVKEKLS
ncbi:MAG: GatB/YqeY domain-containing protein [bacterium]|nr:GatB/YqeY domain-containing protein [bacterium]